MVKSLFKIRVWQQGKRPDLKFEMPVSFVFCMSKEHEPNESLTKIRERVILFVNKLLAIPTTDFDVDYVGPFVEPLKAGSVDAQRKNFSNQFKRVKP